MYGTACEAQDLRGTDSHLGDLTTCAAKAFAGEVRATGI